MGSHFQNLAGLTRGLLTRGGTTESGQHAGALNDADLGAAVATVLARAAASRAAIEPGAALPPEVTDLERLTARTAVSRVRSVLEKIEGGLSPNNLSDDDASALELIVKTVGRPAMRYRGSRVETPSNSLADNSRWFVLVGTQRAAIERISSGVGRIAFDAPGQAPVIGTGWRAGADLIVTNHHVAKEFVKQSEDDPSVLRFAQTPVPIVDFNYTDGAAVPSGFRIKEAVCWDATLDLAVLRLDIGSKPPPAPLPIDWTIGMLGREVPVAGAEPGSPHPDTQFKGSEVYAVGHPWKTDGTKPIRDVFGDADGRKRWSPGEITRVDSGGSGFGHDCSTLGGNSGSCIVSTQAAPHVVVGLHYGGRTGGLAGGLGVTNFATSFAKITDHPAAKFLR